jgi:transposase InsO family protein
VIGLAREWEQVDLSHRKLAHRGSRLDVVYVSESSVLRVLTEAGVVLPGLPRPAPRERKAFPDWAELIPGVIWCYDFTHFAGLPGWCAIAILDVVSKYCLALNLYPEETSTQVEAAFIDALTVDGKTWLLGDEVFMAELATGHVPDPDYDELTGTDQPGNGQVPVLLAVSDNGPQMPSKATASFMAAARIGQHFGRPGTPNDQAWIESFFGHLKTEHPHLDTIRDPQAMRDELDHLRDRYNTVRLHEGIGYVTPEDEHTGRGPAIRKARKEGLQKARANRIASHRKTRHNRTNQQGPNDGN